MARRLSLIAALIAAAACALPAAAQAQSARYPPDAADADREAETRSTLWESALDPERQPYEELVRDGRRALDEQSEHGWQLAVDKLSDAIRRVPRDPRAYSWRGEAYLALRDWARCAGDLAAAEDRHPAPSPDHDRQELELGICQGRAGRIADAEQTLVHLVERAPRGETWLQLGEVRIALGKLDEAIDALTAALDKNDGQSIVAHWLLASAYDRARRPTNAETEAQLAISRDITLSALVNPIYPWIGRGESDYLMGLAYSTATAGGIDANPDYALVYFRHFIAVAPDSPWKRRVDEHVRAILRRPLPQAVVRNSSSSAVVETALMRPALERAMPALRACVAKQPTAAYRITIVKDGPRTSEPTPDQSRYAMRPQSVKAELGIDVGTPAVEAATVEATRACLEPLAARIALPIPKERDTWYQVSFSVIAP